MSNFQEQILIFDKENSGTIFSGSRIIIINIISSRFQPIDESNPERK